jgi:predicted nucleic acid-binding protein
VATLMVDTDVYSYVTSTNPRRGAPYKRHLEGQTIALSFITVGELHAGYEKKIQRGEWPASLLQRLESELAGVTIVPYDIDICRTYGRLKAQLKNPDGSARTVAANDLWIAACAVRHALPLVTNNAQHFTDIPGLKIITEPPV